MALYADSASFSYDAVGNRTQMIDGLGTTTYQYDQLSRLVSETRGFTGLGNFPISYQYNLANDLSSITDAANTTINYTRDSIGRLTSIAHTGQTFASAISYRAWGAMKHMVYGDNSVMDATFNARLQPATFNIPGKISKSYQYNDDGTLRFSSDFRDHRFDRSYGFDHAGRINSALSGAEARGEATTTNRPYNQTYGYDALGHMTQRTVKTWWTNDFTSSQTFVNNRRVGWQYDADGREVNLGGYYVYDAAGRNSYLETSSDRTATMSFDGDGRQSKTVETYYDEEWNQYTETKYYVRSTVLGGQVLTEVLDGQSQTFIYGGPAVVAWIWRSFGYESADYEQRDPSGATAWRSAQEQVLDPTGADSGTFATSIPPTEQVVISYGSSYPANANFTYSIDGVRVPVDDFFRHGGFILTDTFGLLEDFARRTERPKIPPPHVLDPLDERRALLEYYERLEERLSFEGQGVPDLTLLLALPPQNPGLDPSISTLVSNALASSDCIEFARTVLNGVSNKKNPVFPANGSLIDVFNAFLAQGANHPLITRNKPSNSWGYGNPVGKIKNGDAAIFSPNGGTTGSDADTVIAELFHLAGKNKYYTDEQLAKAVYNSRYASDADAVIAPEANIFDKQHYQARGWRKDQAYSAYFHYIQMLHCTAVPQPPGHPRRIN